MNAEEKQNRAERIAKLKNDMEKSGAKVVLCQHLESGERGVDHYRNVQIGESYYVWLCGYCSGQLVEEILREFSKTPVGIQIVKAEKDSQFLSSQEFLKRLVELAG
jgi:hypothetical protein